MIHDYPFSLMLFFHIIHFSYASLSLDSFAFTCDSSMIHLFSYVILFHDRYIFVMWFIHLIR